MRSQHIIGFGEYGYRRHRLPVIVVHGREIGRALRSEIESAPLGPQYNELLRQQVDAIQGISSSAAERVRGLQQQALATIPTGARWEDIARDVLAQGEVSRAHANLIARTEVGRAQTTFLQARAQHIGSEGYLWVTSGDRDVRPEHRVLEGRYFAWNDTGFLTRGFGSFSLCSRVSLR